MILSQVLGQGLAVPTGPNMGREARVVQNHALHRVKLGGGGTDKT